MIHFEWDEENARDHWLKHRISFEDAEFVFSDPNCITEPDNRFNYYEERWRTIGMVKDQCLVLAIGHTIEENGNETITIITMRKATPRERKRYGHRKI
jgi:uncharacterized DUF497 family protein